MRTLRLIFQRGSPGPTLVDELTGTRVPDVLRIEPSPLELHEARWFARIFIHERDAAGNFRYDKDQPIQLVELVELQVGTFWEI